MGNDGKKISSYRDLVAWQKARALVKDVYLATRRLPKEEIYGLRQQVRRAVVSVPSNIAEGYGRGSRKEYVRFLQTARVSPYEVETQIALCDDLGYLGSGVIDPLLERTAECSRLLHGLITSLTRDRK